MNQDNIPHPADGRQARHPAKSKRERIQDHIQELWRLQCVVEMTMYAVRAWPEQAMFIDGERRVDHFANQLDHTLCLLNSHFESEIGKLNNLVIDGDPV